MEIESITHPGLVRTNNEDAFLVRHLAPGEYLIAVADGMGGHAAGEQASLIATDTLGSFDFHRCHPQDLVRAVLDADRRIIEASRKDPRLLGMGTTLTAVLISAGNAGWAHVGDSRLYLFREARLHQITGDHTIPGMLLERGEISPEEARGHPLRHILLKCLGSSVADPDSGTFPVAAGDLLLLTSDGLHDAVHERVIAGILASGSTLKEKMNSLLDAALFEGGRDNITAVAVRT